MKARYSYRVMVEWCDVLTGITILDYAQTRSQARILKRMGQQRKAGRFRKMWIEQLEYRGDDLIDVRATR